MLKELWTELPAMIPREDCGSPTVCPQYSAQGQSQSKVGGQPKTVSQPLTFS